MKKFLISEEERINILSMHKSLMKEQVQGGQSQTPQVDILRKAINGGCLKNGQLVASKEDPSKYVYRAKTDRGEEIDYFGDMTYKLRATGKTGNWKLCPEALKINAATVTESLIKEQTSPVDILRKAINGGCLKNGQLLQSKVDPSKSIYRAKTDNGTDIDFYGDMTYKLRVSGKTGKWKMCQGAIDIETKAAADAELKKDNDLKLASYKKLNYKTKDELVADGVDVNSLDKVYDKVTVGTTVLYKPKGVANDPVIDASTADFNADQNAFLERYKKLGYIINPTQVERENYVPYTAKQLGARPDLFPNGITLYYNPNFQKDLKKSSVDDLGNTLANQTPPRDVCKIKIENFYNFFKKRSSLLPDPDAYRREAAKINQARLVVQACKDEYYPKKWGILGGGNKLNEYIEILSADRQGGPSSQGPDKIFRLS